MSISIYLILLIVLLVFNLVFWLLVIWFRILISCDFGSCCSNSESSEDERSYGHRNRGFIDDSPASTIRIPDALRQAMESPPSYEEAIKYDRFGFQPPPVQTSSPQSSSPLPSTERSEVPNNQQNTYVSTGSRPTQLSQSPPRQPDAASTRSRSSTTGSTSLLTPIREEEDDDTPIAVVIDCIGVQASRLVQHCDTKVNLPEGDQLNGHSKC